MKLRRRGLALAVVRDPPDHRVPVNEEDLGGFEIDAGAPVQIGRIADAVSPSPGGSGFVLAGRGRAAAGCCIGKHLGQRPVVASSRLVTRVGMKVGLGVTSIDSITLGDGGRSGRTRVAAVSGARIRVSSL